MNNVGTEPGEGHLACALYMNTHTCTPPCMHTCTQTFICTQMNKDTHKNYAPHNSDQMISLSTM